MERPTVKSFFRPPATQMSFPMAVCEPGWLLQGHGLPTYAVSDGLIVSL